MVLNEHVVMLNAMRVTYAAYWKVYAEANEPGPLCMIEDDVATMYDAYFDNGDLGAYIPDCQIAHFNVGEGDLPC